MTCALLNRNTGDVIRASANMAIGDNSYRSISLKDSDGVVIVAVALIVPVVIRDGGGAVYVMPGLLILALATTVGGKI